MDIERLAAIAETVGALVIRDDDGTEFVFDDVTLPAFLAALGGEP